MTMPTTEPLGALIDRSHRPREPGDHDEVWNLNLDQIEPHSGRVLAKRMVSTSDLGPSTFAFDRGTVLYSKLRPYLNKVVVADDAGVATTELVPLRCDDSRLARITWRISCADLSSCDLRQMWLPARRCRAW